MISPWRSIRTFADLKTFQNDFRALSEDDKTVMIAEMVFEIEAYRQKEAQTDLERPPQAEKPLVRARRRRNGRV